jgi:predicted lactoylglutathione lyase
VQVVERDFYQNGKMKGITDEDTIRRIKGHLPMFSVDTVEEVEAVIDRALEVGELVRQSDGGLVEMSLYSEQTIANLNLAGERLAAIHAELKAAGRFGTVGT